MRVTDVRLLPMPDHPLPRLLAFAAVTFDGAFVVHDVRLIVGAGGRPFVAMPNRRLTDACPGCGRQNALAANYCNRCGGALPPGRVTVEPSGRPHLALDVAHPVRRELREEIEAAVVAAWERSRAAGVGA